MEAFISIDLEGLPHIVVPAHLDLKGSLYTEARKIATKIVIIAAEELKKNGFEEVLVTDSHGPGVSVLIDELPDFVEIIRGSPKPVSMVAGVEGCDVALFLGYHSKFGTTRSTFDHTYSGSSINQLKINDLPVSECLLNAYVSGEYRVPVILVGGDYQLLLEDVEKYLPWAEQVVFKRSLSRTSSKSSSMLKIEKELRESIQKAVQNFQAGQVQLLEINRNVIKTQVRFNASHFTDVAELVPTVTRIDGLTVEYDSNSMVQMYKTFQLLALASLGVSYLHNMLK